jgi:hypothetical protein
MAAALQPSRSAGSSAAAPTFINDATLALVSGQRLKLAPCHAPSRGRFVAGAAPHGVALVAACPAAGLLALVGRELAPTIQVRGYPDCEPVAALQDEPSVAGYSALAFSRDGARLVAATDETSLQLVVWDVHEGAVLMRAALGATCVALSVFPGAPLADDAGRICVQSPAKLTVWSTRRRHTELSLLASDAGMPAEAGAGAAWTAHAWGPAGVLFAGTDTGHVVIHRPGVEPSIGALLSCAVGALAVDMTHIVVGGRDGRISWHALPSAGGPPSPALFALDVGTPVASLIYAPSFGQLVADLSGGGFRRIEYAGPWAAGQLPLERVPDEESAAMLTVTGGPGLGRVLAAALVPPTAPMLPTSYQLITCGADFIIRCVDSASLEETARTALPPSAAPTALAASAPAQLVAVGTADGVLRLYRLSSGSLIPAFRARLSASAVVALAVDPAGETLAAACADGQVHWVTLAPGGPAVYAHTALPSPPTAAAWGTAPHAVLLVALACGVALQLSPPPTNGATPASPPRHAPLTSLQPRAGGMGATAVALVPATAAARRAHSVAGNRAAFFMLGNDGVTRLFALAATAGPDPHALGVIDAAAPLAALDQTLPTDKPATLLAISGDELLLAIGASDGSILVVPPDRLGQPAATARLHDSVLGGVAGLALLPRPAGGGSLTVLSVGFDGVVYETQAEPPKDSEAQPVVPVHAREMGSAPAAALAEPDEPASEPTVLDAAAGQGEQAEASATAVRARAEMEALAEELRELWEANAAREEDDLERLTVEDLIIDLGQQQAWRDEGAARVDELKQEIHAADLKRALVVKRMRAEFWDAMEVPATTMHALGDVPPAAGTRVANYALPRPRPDQARALAHAKLFRSVELLVSAQEAKVQGPAAAFENPRGFAANIAVPEAAAATPAADIAEASDPKQKHKKKEATGEAGKPGEEPQQQHQADPGRLEYPMFEVATHWRRAAQIQLMGDRVRSLKQGFNAKFQATFAAKTSSIDAIWEKQMRVSDILSELRRLGVDEPNEVLQAALHPDEEPEKVLEVTDADISAAKWVSPAERDRLAKLRAEAEAREAAANADSVAKRGLMTMMDGTLEVKSEEEEIFDDVPRPDCLDKPEEDRTEEERGVVRRYEESVRALQAEREKRASSLRVELGKIKEEVAGIAAGFNAKLAALADTRVDYEEARHEAELLIVKWSQARMRRDVDDRQAAALKARRDGARARRDAAAASLEAFREEVGAAQRACEALAADDKRLERDYKREAQEQPELADALLRLFRRRAAAEPPAGAAARPPRDPFGEPAGSGAPPPAAPLHPGTDAPEGCTAEVWHRLVEARTAKIQSEEEIRRATSTLGEMVGFLQAMADAEEQAGAEFDAANLALAEHRAAVLNDARDVQLPFKLKQGQVEVEEAAVVTDYSRAVLMPASKIRQLNADIKRLGGAKVGLLEEIRDFRRGIVQLLWDAERVQMETEDLVEQTRDFQLLRVTKDLQEVIRGGSEESQAEETHKLERKLAQVQATHADRMADVRRQQRKVARLVADKRAEMESLGGQIEQLEGSVQQREMIHEVQSRSKGAAEDKATRFEEVHMKTKLHSLVKMQTQEIELLRDELDRLRRRTFPTFTHIEAVRSAEAGLG